MLTWDYKKHSECCYYSLTNITCDVSNTNADIIQPWKYQKVVLNTLFAWPGLRKDCTRIPQGFHKSTGNLLGIYWEYKESTRNPLGIHWESTGNTGNPQGIHKEGGGSVKCCATSVHTYFNLEAERKVSQICARSCTDGCATQMSELGMVSVATWVHTYF